MWSGRSIDYCRSVLDLWFFAGLAMGIIVTGFCAVGSFERGAASVRRRAWSLEHSARQRASDPRTPVRMVVRSRAG